MAAARLNLSQRRELLARRRRLLRLLDLLENTDDFVGWIGAEADHQAREENAQMKKSLIAVNAEDGGEKVKPQDRGDYPTEPGAYHEAHDHPSGIIFE